MRYLEGKDREQFSCSSSLSDLFVEWFVGVTIDNFGTIDWKTLWNILSENYELASAEKAIFEFVSNTFMHNGAISLNEEQAKLYSLVKNYLFALHKSDLEPEKIDLNKENNSLLISVYSSKIILKHTQFKEIDLQLLYFNYLKNKDQLLNRLKEALQKADEDKKLSDLFVSDGIEQLYGWLNVKYVSDLRDAPLSNISDALFFALNQLIQNIQLSENDAITLLEERIDVLNAKLMDFDRSNYDLVFDSQGIGNKLTKPQQRELNKRYGLDPFSLDRKKRDLLKKADEIDNQLIQLLCVVLFSRFGSRKYYEYELLTEILKPETLDLLCLIAEYSDNLMLSYDRKHYIFYNPSLRKLEDLLNSISETMDDLIHFNDYSTCSLLKKKLISENWSKKQKYYLRKELTELKLATAMMDEKFPQGYHIQNDYEKLCSYLRDKYGNDFDCPSISVVTWKLQKDDHFCQVDRGTYMLWSKCPELDLLEQAQIIDYIQSAGEIVYYDSIFEHFKDEFKNKGICNKYFVKGVVDHYIDGYGYEVNRDFIKKEGSSITGKQAILQKIMEFDDVFTLQQLRNSFPGVKDYTFQIVIQESDEIIAIGGNKYVTLANSGVTEIGEEMMIQEAQDALNAGGGKPLIAKKILTRIKLFHDDWKKELGHVSTPTALYCFLSKSDRANELFEFKRPYVAEKGTNKEEMNFKTSLLKTLSKRDEITLDDLRKTIIDLGVNKNYPINFVDIIEELSDEFLLIDRFKLVKIKTLYLTRDNIEKIKTRLLAVITSKKKFDNTVKANFKSFPKEVNGLLMNEYLVLGIAMTYLQNEFDCELITKGAKLDYVIKEA